MDMINACNVNVNTKYKQDEIKLIQTIISDEFFILLFIVLVVIKRCCSCLLYTSDAADE